MRLLLALCAAIGAAGAAGAGNGPRSDHAVGYYDARLERVVVVGGAGDPKAGERDAAWSWSGTAWERIPGDGPPARVNAGAAYDASRNRAVVVGGARKTADGAKWEVVGDVWEGDADGWRALADFATRDHQSLVEDGRGGVLMYGGIPADRSAPWPTDTWRLENGRFTRVAADGPAGRGRAAMVYDTKRREVVLFGGVGAPDAQDNQTFFGDTWIWNGKAWRQVKGEGPRGRYAHGMAYDDKAGVVLVYGGSSAHRNGALRDLWRWDGARWTEIAQGGVTPGDRYQPVMVHDRARGKTVLFGGLGNPSDTWEWDGGRWRQAARED